MQNITSNASATNQTDNGLDMEYRDSLLASGNGQYTNARQAKNSTFNHLNPSVVINQPEPWQNDCTECHDGLKNGHVGST